MRNILFALLATMLVGISLWAWRPFTKDFPGRASVSVDVLANGRPVPEIGLLAPLPTWLPLPKSGRAITAGVYPSQPPYGTASSIMLTIEEPGEQFLATYQRQLEEAGFKVSRLPAVLAPTDVADARLEAHSGRDPYSVFVAVRMGRYIQLTFWDGLIPVR